MNLRHLTLILFFCLLSCSKEAAIQAPQGPVRVGISVSESEPRLRSTAGPDGLTTKWQQGDAIALWAESKGRTLTLDGEPFTVYGLGSDEALFSATLDAPMPDANYSYIAAYPVPERKEGLTAWFSVPVIQDGCSGSGEDLMVSAPATGGALAPIDWHAAGRDIPHLQMKHLLHRLRIYTDAAVLRGEKIERVTLTFPSAVAGTVKVDLRNPAAGTPESAASKVIDIRPETPVEVGSGYITASIIPASFKAGDELVVKIYSTAGVSENRVSLSGRRFAAGRSTPVKVMPSHLKDNFRITLGMGSNLLGEELGSITLKAPQGCALNDSGATSLTLDAAALNCGAGLDLDFETESIFRSLSGKTLEAVCETEHVLMPVTLKIPVLDGKTRESVTFDLPYLLSEDFSSVGSFSSNDAYGTSSMGSKDAHKFLDGWTGGRIGAQAGKCIRIACRRETSADYDARVDSAPLSGALKSPVCLKVEFDYGADEDHGGILSSAVGQDCYIGYTTSTTAFKSGDTNGTFDRSLNTFYIKETTGSWDNTPNHAEYILDVAEAPQLLRICIRTEVEHMAGANNSTDWLYIDNVKVSIAQQ